MTGTHTLAFLEPGHFHAALTLKTSNSRVSPDIHVYATPGPEREAFRALIEAFNARDEAPTAWRVHVHEASDPRARLIEDGFAGAVVLAGRNATKLEDIAALHRAGLAVLADKPWLTEPAALPYLSEVTAAMPLALDIMTSRHDVLARLRAAVCGSAAVFGEFRDGEHGEPAVEIGSTHHLFKRVNGVPLARPAWYYDVRVQGDGLVDIQSHMVDQMQWLLEDGVPFDLARDVDSLHADRWGTPVDLALFSDSTGIGAFPDSLAPCIEGDTLDLQCNSLVRYRLRGVSVAQRAEWGQREPEGSGDIHAARLRGSRAELLIEHGPQTGFEQRLHLLPRPGGDAGAAARAALPSWQAQFPGLDLKASAHGLQFVVPAALRTTHEQHFAEVLNDFLDRLELGVWPAELAARIRMRYALLAAAKTLVDGDGSDAGSRR